MRRVVITGAGAVSPFGVGLPILHAALAEGRSAVGPIRWFDASSLPTRVAGEVPDSGLGPRASGLGDRDRKVRFGLAAALEAWRAAGCGDAEKRATLSIALGLEQAFLEDFEPADFPAPRGDGPDKLRFRARVDLAADAIRATLGLTGPTLVNVSACAAGGLAIADAAALVARGDAEVVLCGGADSMVNPLGVGGMARIGAPSPRNEPDACRPFDRRRDGLAIGEGAAMFVVEAEERARGRGARPIAHILGWGSTQDAYRATAPRPDGSRARAAIERALARAGVAPRDVSYVNAHGTGTPLNDPTEARAISSALRGARPPVSSIKGAIGHLMAASGAIEVAACLLPFERGVLPGTAHLREVDPECAAEIDVIGPSPRRAEARVVVSNSFGFGGQNVCLVLGAP